MQLIKYVFKLETRRQVLLMILVTAGVVLGFINIAIEGRIIDDAVKSGAGSGNLNLLLRYVLLYFAIIAITSSLSYFTDVLFNETTQRILIHLRTDLFARVLRLDQSFFTRTPIGEVISRIVTEVQQLGGFLSKIILVPLSCLITIIAGFGLIAGIDLRLAAISLGIYSVVFIFLPPLRRKIKKLSKGWGRQMRSINRRAEESVSHYGQVQSHNTFAFEQSRFTSSLWDFFNVQMNMARAYGATGFLSSFFSELANLSVYGVGGYLIIRATGADGLTIGSIFIMIRVLGNIIKPINTLIDFFQRIGEAQVKFDMVSDYLSIPPDVTDAPDARDVEKMEGRVTLTDVTFGFSADDKIIDGISLEIPPGKKAALVGPAGCGKSTLALLANGLLKPKSGKITIDGVEIQKITQKSLRRFVGYVPQAKTGAPVLFGGTLADNLLYGLKEKDDNPGGGPEGWLNLESFGYNSLDELGREVLEIINDVGFYRDVFNFGLSKVTLHQALERTDDVFRLRDPEAIRTEILKGRKKFRQIINDQDRELIEFFDSECYMDHCSVIENLIFTSPEPVTADKKLYDKVLNFLEPICRESGIADKIEEIGHKIAAQVVDLVHRLGMNRSHLESNPSVPGSALALDLEAWSERLKTPRESLSAKDRRKLLKVGMDYVAAQGIDLYIDDEFRRSVVTARRKMMNQAQGIFDGDLAFYDRDNYVDGATIRQNIIMGKVNTSIFDSESRINKVMDQVIREIQLEDEIISLGLLMDVGERGSRLSGGQAQKTAIARVFLKRPRVLILDEATSALDNHSQKAVSGAIEKRFADATVITIAHRLDTIRDYDRICVLSAGRLEESGSFDRLMEKNGLFARLWESSYGKGREK